jgi:hypothetical protein
LILSMAARILYFKARQSDKRRAVVSVGSIG